MGAMIRTVEDVERELVAAVDAMRGAFARFDEADLLLWQARLADCISTHAQQVEVLALELVDLRGVAS
jgi:hypothetical protein